MAIPSFLDETAMVIMALACAGGQRETVHAAIVDSLNNLLYQRQRDGSYGSLYTTALVLQVSIVTVISVPSCYYVQYGGSNTILQRVHKALKKDEALWMLWKRTVKMYRRKWQSHRIAWYRKSGQSSIYFLASEGRCAIESLVKLAKLVKLLSLDTSEWLNTKRLKATARK